MGDWLNVLNSVQFSVKMGQASLREQAEVRSWAFDYGSNSNKYTMNLASNIL